VTVKDFLLGRNLGIEQRALTKETVPAAFFPGDGVGPTVGEKTALTLADVWACVRVLSSTAAAVPLLTYRRTEDGRVRWGGMPQPLVARPAPAVNGSAMIATLVAHLAASGDAFVGIFRDDEGAVAQLGPLDPSMMTVEIVGGMPFYTYTSPDGRQQVLGIEDVCHIHTLSLDGVTGRSPIAACRDALSLNAALAQSARALMENGAVPAGILTVTPGPGAQDAAENLKKDWNPRHQGPANRGRMGFLTGEVTWTPVSMSLADAEFLAQREWSTREVARVMGVPAFAIGGTEGDSLTYANALDRKRALLDAVGVYLVQIEESITNHPALCPPDVYVEFERMAWLLSDPAALAESLGAQIAAGILTPNEARARMNLEAHPDGDGLRTSTAAQPSLEAAP
jgi:HK97 family phage portal protein